MRAVNDTAAALIKAAAAERIMLVPGYFGTENYCAGVRVANLAEAFDIGAKLGAKFGAVHWDTPLNESRGGVVVFVDTRVQA